MIWIVKEDQSHEIISCNIHEEGGMFQVWATRPNDKSFKLDENKDRKVVMEIKEAIDFAIERGEGALRL